MRAIWFCGAALALLGGCEAKVGGGGNESAASSEAAGSAEGKAEEGRIALKAPGFDISIAVPEKMAGARSDRDSDLLYPGSAISGMYIAAGEGGGKGEVELRFTSPDAPEKVAAWYRDPARGADFSAGEAKRSGSDILIEGQEKSDGQAFKLRLGARAGGGTDGRLTVRDRS